MTTSAADHDDPTKATITDAATLIAAGAGAGLSPVAPGTAGSIVATALLAFLLDMPVIWHWWGWFGLTALAVWSSKRAGAAWGVIDHPAIVIDEFAGQQFGNFKPKLADLVVAKLSPISSEMSRLMNEPGEIDKILMRGAHRGRELAVPILQKTYDIVGMLR